MARRRKHLFRKLLTILVITALLPVAFAVLYKFVPVPLTPLMVQRLFEGEPLHKKWVPLARIHPSVVYSVVASEDNLFCQHSGFDWKALQEAYDTWQAAQLMDDEDARIKGGSTISQQTAKNVFLLTIQSPVRKVLEFPLTLVIEQLWGKKRIMEVYLNVAEWGHGIYGVEAASQKYFGTSARNLTWRQGAQLASILPSPRKWPINGGYAQGRASRIQERITKLGPLLDCVRVKGAYAPAPVRVTPAPCPNCQKSKQPAGVSNPPSSTQPEPLDLPPLPSAMPVSASAYPPASPSDSPAPESQDLPDAPNTSSSGSTPDQPAEPALVPMEQPAPSPSSSI